MERHFTHLLMRTVPTHDNFILFSLHVHWSTREWNTTDLHPRMSVGKDPHLTLTPSLVTDEGRKVDSQGPSLRLG